jgi:hypothetical protein
MSTYPPDPPPPGDYSPGNYAPLPPEHDPYATPRSDVSSKVTPAAVGILVVAVLNLVAGIFMAGVGVVYTRLPPEQLEEMFQKQNPAQFEQLKQQGLTVQSILNIYIYGGLGGGCMSFVISLITILGAIRMMMLRSHGLAVFAAILTAIPCLSPSACCLVGIGVGIWALVVLLNPDVQAAFR